MMYTNSVPAGVMELVDVVDSKPLLRTRALPAADEARVQQVPRSAENEPASSGDVFAGHRKRWRQRTGSSPAKRRYGKSD